MLREEMERLEDAAYICYKQGFDEALTQVKHFANGSMVDLSRVDQERKLDEILVKEAPTDRNAQEVPPGMTVRIGAEEEEEEGGNLRLP